MSMSFEIFPTKAKTPKCDEIIQYSVYLFNDFLKKERINQKIEVTTREVSVTNEVNMNPIALTERENHYTVFNLNKEGEVYVFYRELKKLDNDFWSEELQENKNAQSIKEKINGNLTVGYSWNVKRTMGQPAIVSLYYGYLAIAIAELTDGIIYSDDGAWDYSCLPVESNNFKEQYLNLEKLSDATVKNNIESWMMSLRNK